MVIYSKYNFAFQHINKCGGYSVRSAIRNIVGDSDPGSKPPGSAHQPMRTRILRLAKFHPEYDIENIKIYANVRNPFDRIVSIYSYRTQRMRRYKSKTFEDFFYNVYAEQKTIPSGPIHPMLLVDNELPKNVTVIKLEQADQKWPDIIKKHFGFKPKIEKLNQSSHSDPMMCFDRKMVDIVKDIDWWIIKNFYPELLNI